ncbi:MAG: 50S ribosomal protein L30e [Euryarchaeota archaeon]|nr:50S ribosomal protein L30e [Euryarchaeota archaeon]|tara:strand:+ start:197 stop:511 length:315 start_codon:yes stop_codon:yes gene_type:complete
MRKMSMDIVREIKDAIATGDVTIGSRTTLGACSRGEISLVLIAANCPADMVADLVSKHPEVVLHQLDIVNRDLGTACGKPFSVAAVGVRDAGSSELLTLEGNLA